MRKYIVKYFTLNYVVNLFNKKVSWTRSANIIFPIFMLFGIFAILDVTFMLYLLFISLIISLYFGFVHFRFNPLTDDDLIYMDEVQKSLYQGKEITTYNKSITLLVNVIALTLFLITLKLA